MENPGDVTIASRLERFNEVARIVTGVPDATAQQGALFLETLVSSAKMEEIFVQSCDDLIAHSSYYNSILPHHRLKI